MASQDIKFMFQNLKKAEFPEKEQFEFLDELKKGKYVAYHYELLCDAWKDDDENNFYRLLYGYFAYHFKKYNGDCVEFFLEKLQVETEIKIQVNLVYYASAQTKNLEHIPELYQKYCTTLIPYLISFSNISFVELRRKAIIALGWIGKEEHIEFLLDKMLTDTDSLCRTWASTSIMQMSFHRIPLEIIKTKTTSTLLKAIMEETDIYACGCMILTAQELYAKKWISGLAVDNRDKEKIEKARKTAIRVLKRIVNAMEENK